MDIKLHSLFPTAAIFNSSTYQIKFEDDMLVIFSSHIWYFVPENKSFNWKVSIEFNSFLLGEICNYGYEELKVKSVSHV
jgi:NOL1/NOP2/fmu family ribosome biogenesis protein